jgi:hypothetical protein
MNTTKNKNGQLTMDKVLSILDNYVNQEMEYIAEHDKIRAILLPLVGKPIDGRSLNKKVLGEFKFVPQYGMYYIKGKFEHLIGYQNSENLIAVEKTDYSRGFEYFDNCHGGAARERIKQIETTNKDKVLKIYGEIEQHFNALRTLFGRIEDEKLGSYHFPAYYDLLNSIYKEENSSDLKLTDFYFIRN